MKAVRAAAARAEAQAALVSGACRLSLREVDCSAQAVEATDTAALQRLALASCVAAELDVSGSQLAADECLALANAAQV